MGLPPHHRQVRTEGGAKEGTSADPFFFFVCKLGDRGTWEDGHWVREGTNIRDLPVPRKLKVYPKGSACPGNW